MALTPFQEGVVAAKLGKRIETNPYRPGTDMCALWSEGFVAALAVTDSEADVEQGKALPIGPKGQKRPAE